MNLRLAVLKSTISMLLVAIAVPSAADYSTSFNNNESPISEGGRWHHTGLDWTYVQTVGGIAFGTQTGLGETDDSYAYLSGFANDQRGEAKIYVSPTADMNCSKETEILLRWSDSDHNAQGYEALFTGGGTVQIVRWDGPFNAYTVLATAFPGCPGGSGYYCDGHVVRGEIVGNTIKAYIDGVLVAQATDNTYPTGQPGIGFFRRSCGTAQDVGFYEYTATSLGSAPEPAPQPTAPPPPVLLP